MNRVECVLECGDIVDLEIDSTNAAVGEFAYCRFDSYRQIVEIRPAQWRVVCTRCAYGRWTQQNQPRAIRLADGHKHECIVIYDTVTKTGGTPRREVIRKALQEPSDYGTLIENEPPPY